MKDMSWKEFIGECRTWSKKYWKKTRMFSIKLTGKELKEFSQFLKKAENLKWSFTTMEQLEILYKSWKYEKTKGALCPSGNK